MTSLTEPLDDCCIVCVPSQSWSQIFSYPQVFCAAWPFFLVCSFRVCNTFIHWDLSYLLFICLEIHILMHLLELINQELIASNTMLPVGRPLLHASGLLIFSGKELFISFQNNLWTLIVSCTRGTSTSKALKQFMASWSESMIQNEKARLWQKDWVHFCNPCKKKKKVVKLQPHPRLSLLSTPLPSDIGSPPKRWRSYGHLTCCHSMRKMC